MRVAQARTKVRHMPDDQPPFLKPLLDELRAGGPYQSDDDLQRAAERLGHAYNARPQAELGGLSPNQLREVLNADWSSPDSAVQLNDALSLDDLGGAPMFADARTILDYVAAHGPLKETAAHNLSRAAVAAICPRLELVREMEGDKYGEGLAPTIVNEGDVYWLLLLRYVLMFAGLIRRHKGFRITARGRELLRDDRAGELFALLFRTLFRKFDMQSMDMMDQPALQATAAYSLYRLSSCAAEWSSSERLASLAWLETAMDPVTPLEAQLGIDLRYFAFRNRILLMLVAFGLLDERVLPTMDVLRRPTEYRVKPLYRQFVRFRFSPNAGPGLALVP
ncbi:MAG: hypothetical protein ACREND_18220 [Gemmatimonadaceae bacterium]